MQLLICCITSLKRKQKSQKKVGEEMDIREIDGLWCDDITFCPEDCEDMDCPRNKHNIRDRRFPHSYFVERAPDCPKKKGDIQE